MSTEATTTTSAETVAPTDPLARISLELLAEYRTAAEARDAADRALAEHPSPTATALDRLLSDAVTDLHAATTDFQVAEVCRHAPGLAPAIRILWAHVLDCRLDRVGVCCTDGGPGRAVGGRERPRAPPHSPGHRPGLSFCAWRAARVWAVGLFPHRWPIIFVAPVLVYGGYSWREAAILAALIATAAEVVFTIVRVWLLERRY